MPKTILHFYPKIQPILPLLREGGEKEVFETSGKWIERVNSVVVELHERKKKGCDKSFYDGSKGFTSTWTSGENVCVARDGFIFRS